MTNEIDHKKTLIKLLQLRGKYLIIQIYINIFKGEGAITNRTVIRFRAAKDSRLRSAAVSTVLSRRQSYNCIESSVLEYLHFYSLPRTPWSCRQCPLRPMTGDSSVNKSQALTSTMTSNGRSPILTFWMPPWAHSVSCSISS